MQQQLIMPTGSLQVCYRCNEEKDLSEYPEQSGTRVYCRSCLRHPNQSRKHVASRFEGSPCINGCGRTRYRRNNMCVVCRSTRTPRPGNRRLFKHEDTRLRRAYGISLAERDSILKQQEGRCAICAKVEHASDHRLCVDHDHETGRVRGLLCYNCNRALGYFGESAATLKLALQYLEASSL